ncbi:MAG: FIST N-terminal domain-containing protein [Opitutaceae bacterium]|nr:FIST N-terminal domain-containing protein [Opitutaceae bacterium]
MNSTTLRWSRSSGWSSDLKAVPAGVSLVLYFGATDVLAASPSPIADLLQAFPDAVCAGCSSAGEIRDHFVEDDGLSVALVAFTSTSVKAAVVSCTDAGQSAQVGRELAARLQADGLRHVLVLSDGLHVNGSQLTEGLRAALPAGVTVSGGLAGDGARFSRTMVGLGPTIAEGQVVLVGFYGESLRVSHGSAGGWQPFGPKRLITAARGNVLQRLDDQPALALYKRYLGDLAEGLPATGLLFPLQLLPDREGTDGVVRTILAVNEADQSLTFAGDMPVGHYARLMKAGCDALVDGADHAALLACEGERGESLAILVSCVGRKLVMKQRVEEEVEAVLERLGGGVRSIGFYSYGEICPSGLAHGCDFHNQTMTLTVISESVG